MLLHTIVIRILRGHVKKKLIYLNLTQAHSKPTAYFNV